MNTLISNFEQQNTITCEWLSKVSAGGACAVLMTTARLWIITVNIPDG